MIPLGSGPSGAFAGWLLQSSLQASALILVVLAVGWILRHRISAHWRVGLWLLVVLRLLLPWTPESRI
jgi:bla regulator protein blaR1